MTATPPLPPPSLLPEMRLVLDRLAVEDAGLGDPTLLPPAEGRALAARSNQRWNLDLPPLAGARTLSVTRADGDPVPLRLLTPPDAAPGLILFIHGGGWAFCSTATHERAARLLALEAGVAVATFDYRLAPEDPFPAGLDDCIALWRRVAAGGIAGIPARGPLAISGDSAGANLALALMLHELSHGRRVPDLGLLFYGVYGADFDTPSHRQCADGPGLTRAKMMRYWDWYAPHGAVLRSDPLVAPLCAGDDILADLPPLYLNAAEVDPLRSDSEALHARLRALGRADVFRLHAGVVHGFMQMTSRLAAARAATAEAGAAFRQMTGASNPQMKRMEETSHA
ncbi:MAG: alpha/beta hydrolase [Alphaproteobacteria bacterium]